MLAKFDSINNFTYHVDIAMNENGTDDTFRLAPHESN